MLAHPRTRTRERAHLARTRRAEARARAVVGACALATLSAAAPRSGPGDGTSADADLPLPEDLRDAMAPATFSPCMQRYIGGRFDGLGQQLWNLFGCAYAHGWGGRYFDIHHFLEASRDEVMTPVHYAHKRKPDPNRPGRLNDERHEVWAFEASVLAQFAFVRQIEFLQASVRWEMSTNVSAYACPPPNITFIVTHYGLLAERPPAARATGGLPVWVRNVDAFRAALHANLAPRRLPHHAVVAHVRLGDSLHARGAARSNAVNAELMLAAVRAVRAAGFDGPLHVHSDGDPSTHFGNLTYTFHSAEENSSLRALADCAHAAVLLGANSGMSVLALLAGAQRLVIAQPPSKPNNYKALLRRLRRPDLDAPRPELFSSAPAPGQLVAVVNYAELAKRGGDGSDVIDAGLLAAVDASRRGYRRPAARGGRR